MFNSSLVPALPYDQVERFEGIDELIAELEDKWQQDKEDTI